MVGSDGGIGSANWSPGGSVEKGVARMEESFEDVVSDDF